MKPLSIFQILRHLTFNLISYFFLSIQGTGTESNYSGSFSNLTRLSQTKLDTSDLSEKPNLHLSSIMYKSFTEKNRKKVSEGILKFTTPISPKTGKFNQKMKKKEKKKNYERE